MSIFTDFVEGWRTVAGTVWPEVIPNGIWEAEHAAQVPFVNKPVPSVAMVVSEFRQTGDWGVTNRVWTCNVELYYVMDVRGSSSLLRPKLEEMADYLWNNTLPVGQLQFRNVDICYDMSMEINSLFAAGDKTQRAGRVMAPSIFGELRG